MPQSNDTSQFVQSWNTWRNSLSPDQRWMADAIACSATRGADVQGYQSKSFNADELGTWLQTQNPRDWQAWADTRNDQRSA
jgi:hypothetical protein